MATNLERAQPRRLGAAKSRIPSIFWMAGLPKVAPRSPFELDHGSARAVARESLVPGRNRLPRRAVRFPVRFRSRHEPNQVFQAFASNVSAGGMFITTRRPLPPRTAVELEIERPDGTVTIQAQVVHAARVPPLYQSVFKSGMGVRFRRPDEAAVREIGALGVPLPDRGGRREYPR